MKNIAVIAYSLTIEYTLKVIEGINNYFSEKDDVNLIVVPLKAQYSQDNTYDYQYWSSLELLKSETIDAVIVVTNSFLRFMTVEQLSKALENLLPKPIISVSTPLNLPDAKYTCVSCSESYLQVIEHLVKNHNRKRIAFYSASLTNSPESDEREHAYKEALKHFGLTVDESLIYAGDYTPKTCYEYIMEHYERRDDVPYDAILCANDYMAAGCIVAFQKLGISVPEDICVVGFDDTEVAVTCIPTITTINQQIEQTGFRAAEAAYELLCGHKVPDKTIIDSFPVYRQSCGCIAKNLKIHGYLLQNGKMVNASSPTTSLRLFGNGLNDMDILFNSLNLTDSVTNINSFINSLEYIVRMFSIPSLSVVIYDSKKNLKYNEDFSLPEDARLIIHADRMKNEIHDFYAEGGKAFNVKDTLLPQEAMFTSGGIYYLSSIFMKESIYGYLICKLPTTKYPLYTVFLKFLSNAIIQSYEVTKREEENLKLSERNQNLNFEAKTDELTKLFNRRGFQEYGQQLIEVSLASGKKGSVFFCDLDGLKTINDTWGHDIGDLAIKTEAKVLRAAFRDSDLIGRLSGDEFGVIAPGFPVERIELLRERLVLLNKEMSEEAKLPFTLSISIGAVEFNTENSELKVQLKAADKLLYEEKKIKHSKRNEK